MAGAETEKAVSEGVPPVVALVGEPFVLRGALRALCHAGLTARVLCDDENAERELAAAVRASTGATPADGPAPTQPQFIRGNVTEDGALAELLSGAAGVALLAPVGLTGRRWQPEPHVQTATRLRSAAARQGVRAFVYLSSLEAHPASKLPVLRQSAEVEKLVSESGLACHIFRVGPLMGPGDALVTRAVEWAGRPWPCAVVWGYGSTLLQPLHVDDLGRCVARCFAPAPDGLRPDGYTLAGLETTTVLELLDRALAKQKRFKIKFHIPLSLLELAALLGPGRKAGSVGERLGLLMPDYIVPRNGIHAVLGPEPDLKGLAATLDEVLASP